ncbi:MAG: exosome protein [Euryarchaeota archaeon]|nr:exosome protein [Euryarchaeota archaeon]
MIHNIFYRVFVYGTESEIKVRAAVKTLFPKSLPTKAITEGYYKNPVIILSDKINKKRDITLFLKNLKKIGTSSKQRIITQLKNRMDDKGNLFLRFNKQEAYLGNLKVVEHGDSIHVKIKIAAYPANKKTAIKIAMKLFGE